MILDKADDFDNRGSWNHWLFLYSYLQVSSYQSSMLNRDTMKRILIMDDDQVHRSYMADLINKAVDDEVEITEVDNGTKAITLNSQVEFDLLVLDLQVPEKSGIDVAREVWEGDKSKRILFWSQHSDELYVRKLYSFVPNDAIYGYLIKTALDDQIINAIQYILEFDQCWIDPKIRKVKLTTFDKTTGLTDVEYETLVDLTLGLSDNAIAQRRFITKRGIQNRLASLYQKLGVADDQFIHEKWGHVFSPRTRAVTLAIIRGLINQSALEKENEYLYKWIAKLK